MKCAGFVGKSRVSLSFIIGCVMIDSTILSSHHSVIRSWMVQNWQLHCHDFENLDFAKYLVDSSIPLGDFENMDGSKYLNNGKQFCCRLDLLKIWIYESKSQNVHFVKLI